MREAKVEIYSDETNLAVLRHPDRKFPGILVQGDDLQLLCQLADVACDAIDRSSPHYSDAGKLRNALWSYLNHYCAVLGEHDIPVPLSRRLEF